MNRLLLWMAGADRDTLRRCGESRRAEISRLSALGALVVIPAILGLVSMAYAVSTVAPIPAVFIGAGVIWSGIVLVIDRYIVVSTRKRPSSGKRNGVSVAVIARLVFALFVGIAVAHPFILLWFNDSVIQQLNEDRDRAVVARVEQGNAERQTAQQSAQPAQSPALLTQRQKLVDYKNCLTTLQQFEQSNAPRTTLDCGATTGVPTCSQRCLDIGPRIDQAVRDIEDLDRQIDAARAVEGAETARLAPILAGINTRENDDVKRLRDTFSADYLARVNALRAIEERHPEVWVISTFILVFFVLVDVLPVTMKLSTRAGEYDYVQETQLLRVAALEEAVQAEVRDGWVERDLARTNATSHLQESKDTAAKDLQMSRVATMSSLSADFFTLYTERKIEFAEAMSEFRARAGAGSLSAAEELQLKTMQDIDDTAWDKSLKRMTDHLDNL